jgi:hypothetical protein
MRFLREATRDSRSLRQLAAKAEQALVAAIGLDENRRRQAALVFAERFSGLDAALHKAYLASVAIRLEDQPGERAIAYAGAIENALTTDSQIETYLQLGDLPARICAELAAAALVSSTDNNKQYTALYSLKRVAHELNESEASRCAAKLALAIKESVGTHHFYLTDALAVVTDHMDSFQGSQVCGEAARIIADRIQQSDKDQVAGASQAIAHLVRRLNPHDAVIVADCLLTYVVTDADRNYYARASLESLAARLEPVQVAKVARKLAAALEREQERLDRRNLLYVLCSVTGKLEPADAHSICLPAALRITSRFEVIV